MCLSAFLNPGQVLCFSRAQPHSSSSQEPRCWERIPGASGTESALSSAEMPPWNTSLQEHRSQAAALAAQTGMFASAAG